MRARLHDHAVAVALTGAVVAAGVWFVLASVTGLIFHFMPAAPTLAAASVLRWADGWPFGRAERTALLAAGASIALAMALVLAGEGRPLDEPVVTGIAILAGAVIGTGFYDRRHATQSSRTPGPRTWAITQSNSTGRGYGTPMDILRRLAGSSTSCDHVPEALPEAQANRCQECGSGFNLRLCATCGHVGCCESQQGDARAHALADGHPVIYQMPAPKGFVWCYEDRAYVG